MSLALLMPTLHEDADIRVLRSLRERLIYGDEISLTMVNSMVKFPLHGSSVAATISFAPLSHSPMDSESEIHYAVNGIELYESVWDELHGGNWREHSSLLATAALRIFEECGAESLLTIASDKNGHWWSFRIASDDTAALILERGRESLDSILDIVKARKTVDADIIRVILDDDIKALCEGKL